MRKNPYKAELKLARSQRKRLRTMQDRLTDMGNEWEDLSGWLEIDTGQLADSLNKHIEALEEQIRDWSKGMGDRDPEYYE